MYLNPLVFDLTDELIRFILLAETVDVLARVVFAHVIAIREFNPDAPRTFFMSLTAEDGGIGCRPSGHCPILPPFLVKLAQTKSGDCARNDPKDLEELYRSKQQRFPRNVVHIHGWKYATACEDPLDPEERRAWVSLPPGKQASSEYCRGRRLTHSLSVSANLRACGC
jgi:hypothetical protein